MDGFDHELHEAGRQAYVRFVKGASISPRADVARIVAAYSQLCRWYERQDEAGGLDGPVLEGVEDPQAN